MSEKIASLQIFVKGNSSSFTKSLQDAQKGLSVWTIAAGTMLGNFATTAFEKAKSAITSGFDHIGEVGSLAQKLGAPVEEISKLTGAFKLLGMDVENAGHALLHLNRVAGEAAMGTGEAAKLFLELGINAQEFAKMDSSAKLDELAHATQKFTNASDIAVLAHTFFGRQGGESMLKILRMGKDGLDELKQKFADMGGTITAEQTVKVKMAREQWALMNAQWDITKVQITSGLLPAIASITGVLREVTQGFKSFFMTLMEGFLGSTESANSWSQVMMSALSHPSDFTAPFLVRSLSALSHFNELLDTAFMKGEKLAETQKKYQKDREFLAQVESDLTKSFIDKAVADQMKRISEMNAKLKMYKDDLKKAQAPAMLGKTKGESNPEPVLYQSQELFKLMFAGLETKDDKLYEAQNKAVEELRKANDKFDRMLQKLGNHLMPANIGV